MHSLHRTRSTVCPRPQTSSYPLPLSSAPGNGRSEGHRTVPGARARPVALAVPGGWRARRAGAVVCGGGGARRRRCVGRVCRVRRRGRSVFHLNSLQMLLKDHAPGCRCRWPYAQSTMFVTRACFNISLERAQGEWVRGTSPQNERSGTLFSSDRRGDRHDLIDAELRVAARWTMARPTTAPTCSTDLQHRSCEEREEDGLGQLPQLACRATPARQGGGGSEAPRVERGARLHSGVTVSARLLMRP